VVDDNPRLGWEGSHMLHLDGWYYIFSIHWAPEEMRAMGCFRARTPAGPWEGGKFMELDLDNRHAGVAQGGPVQLHDGSWALFLFQDHGAVGRIPVVVPMRWEDGWPVVDEVPKYPELPSSRPEYAYAFEFAQECGCPVTLHFWEDEAINHENITEILERYPKLKVILAHQGGGVRHMTIRTAKLMKQYDRLYIDTCGSLWNRLGIDEIADLVGSDRLCYGSDILFMEPRFEIGRIVFSGLPEETQRKIFSENYLKILEGSQLGQIKLP
jgi:hypothetical protein